MTSSIKFIADNQVIAMVPKATPTGFQTGMRIEIHHCVWKIMSIQPEVSRRDNNSEDCDINYRIVVERPRWFEEGGEQWS